MSPPTLPHPLWPPAQPLPPLGPVALWWAPAGFGKRSRLRDALGQGPCTWLGPDEGPEALAARLGLSQATPGLLFAWLEAQGPEASCLVLPWAPWASHPLGPQLLAQWPRHGCPHRLVLLAEAPSLQPQAAREAVQGWPVVGVAELAYGPESLGLCLEAQGQPAWKAQALWQQTGGWPWAVAQALAGQAEGLDEAWGSQVVEAWPASWQALALAAATWDQAPAEALAHWGPGDWVEGLVAQGAFLPASPEGPWPWRPLARQEALRRRALGPWWRALPWVAQGPVLGALLEAEDQAEAWRVGQDLGWRRAWLAVRQLEARLDEASWQAWPAAQLLAAQVALEAGQEALAQRHLARVDWAQAPAALKASQALLSAQLALGQGAWQEAEALLAQAEALAPQDEALAWAIAQARVHGGLAQGQLESALALAESWLSGPECASPAARRTRLELLALLGSQRAFWGPLAPAEAHLRALLAELELQPSLAEGLGLRELGACALAGLLALQGRSTEARAALALAPEEGEGGEEALLHRARALGLLGEAGAEALWEEALARRSGQPSWAWPAWECLALRPSAAQVAWGDAAQRAAEAGGPLLRAWAALEAVALACAAGEDGRAKLAWAALPAQLPGGLGEAWRLALGQRLGLVGQPPASLEGLAIARLRPLRSAPFADSAAPEPQAPPGPFLQVFGPPSLQVQGEVVTKWPRRQARMLLLALALHPTGVHRSQLLAWLWPHMEEAGASAQLHNATATLRAVLEPQLAHRAPSQHLLWLGQRLRLKGVASELNDAEGLWVAWQGAQSAKGPEARALALRLMRLPPLGGDEAWPEGWSPLRRQWAQRQSLVAAWVAALADPDPALQDAAHALSGRI